MMKVNEGSGYRVHLSTINCMCICMNKKICKNTQLQHTNLQREAPITAIQTSTRKAENGYAIDPI
jgi:putative component of toxin-antitoxin plasmid stabilization module